MAGVKGRSGGPRPNSGGRRPGAGRKPKAAVEIQQTAKDDTLQLLIDIAFGRVEANAQQVRAAVAAVQYTHTKTHDGGKKEAAQKAATEAAGGRFGARPAPLKLVNG